MNRFLIFVVLLLLGNASNAAIGKPAAKNAETKVLIAMDFSGSLKTTARLVELGMKLAVQSHPEMSKTLNIESVDTGEDLITIVKNIETQIAKSRPDVILGAVTSNQAIAISEIAEREKIPYISPFATNPSVTKDKRFTFRACFDDSTQAEALVKFVKLQLKFSKGVVLYNPSQAYARGIQSIFEDGFSKDSKSSLTSFQFNGENSLTEELTQKISDLKPEFVLIPSYQIESAAAIAKLSPKLSKSVIFIGTDSWGGGRLFEQVFKGAAVHFKGFYVQHWSGKSTNAEGKKFVRLLNSPQIPAELKFDTLAMNAPIAVGYDTMLVLLTARQSKGELADAIRKVKVGGATGPIEYLGKQTPSKALSIFSIDENGDKFFKEFR